LNQLRGCIGTFNSIPLHSGLYEYSITSATKDRRFDPIQLSELELLSCNVSLLTNFEYAQDWEDWEVGYFIQIGTHGIIIRFGKSYSATYLPEVALTQNWDHQETIDSLIQKAGYRGSVTNSLRETVQVERYRSSKESMDFTEFSEFYKQP
jgi:uncharacterized protein (TIGR00296 family)